MDALSWQLAVGQRFGARTQAGDAVFVTGLAGVNRLPCTVAEGVNRDFTGVNLLMLLQVMKDRQWTDSRFYTMGQIADAGWTLAKGAKHIGLQYMVSTGDDGLPLDAPLFKQFHVVNAAEVQGVPPAELVDALQPGDVETAATQAGFNGSVDGWLGSLQGSESREPMHSLTRRVALTLLEAQAGVPHSHAVDPKMLMSWALQLEAQPLLIFEAMNDAQALVAQVMSRVQLVRIESDAMEASKKSVALANQDKGGGEMVRTGGASARVHAMYKERAAVLSVPFEDKDRARSMGAVWYPPERIWFVPKGVDVGAFKDWFVTAAALGPAASDDVLLESFREVMGDYGLACSGDILADGAWHNVSVDSTAKKNTAGSYICSLNGGRNGNAIGTVLNKITGEQFTWTHSGPCMTPEQRAHARGENLVREAARALEVVKVQDLAALHAEEIWSLGVDASDHGYVLKKEIAPVGLRQLDGAELLKYEEFRSEQGTSMIRASQNYLMVPMQDCAGRIRAVQAISADGAVKQFMRGAQKKGTMWVLGAESFDAMALLSARGEFSGVAYCEGMATGMSFKAASGVPVVVCFDAGNMETVVAETTGKLPGYVTRMLAVDNDQFHVERSLGFLSDKLGINPHAVGGAVVQVACGAQGKRPVGLGAAVADGQWHDTSKGRYCMSVECGEGDGAVTKVVVEVVPQDGGRKMRSTFVNRGLEVARVGLQAIEASLPGARALVVMPEFNSLVGRPTDWNDLAQNEGVKAVRALLPHGLVAYETGRVSRLAGARVDVAVSRVSSLSR